VVRGWAKNNLERKRFGPEFVELGESGGLQSIVVDF
jgi:hypothetical protein